MTQKGISEIAGRGILADGSTVKLYRALRMLLCEKCGAEIKEGTLFTRWPLLGQAMPIMPHCRQCTPFELQESATRRERSSLISTLLASAREQVETDASPHSEKISEAIEQRLGPALKRTRRHK